MTGTEIRALRANFALSAKQFAQTLGVHVLTVRRWERAGPAKVRIDPLQVALLTLAHDQPAQRQLGKEIAHGLDVGGGMLGLYYLLYSAYGSERARSW